MRINTILRRILIHEMGDPEKMRSVTGSILFIADLIHRDAQPAWLRKSRSLQKRRRATQLRAEACRFAVTVARQYHQKLETEGRAYGDPLAALDVLEAQSQDAEAAVRALEGRRRGLRAAQEKAEVSPEITYVRNRCTVQFRFGMALHLFSCRAAQAH